MKKTRLALVIIFITLIVLEALPFGAVLRFAVPDGEPSEALYSYFSLTPYGYGNFGPFLTALLTCALAVISVILIFKDSKRLFSALKIICAVAFLTSIMPLMFGKEYFTLTATFISLLFMVAFAVTFIKERTK